MSEHPELREALIATLQTFNMDDYDADRADALLAGPVGKLQAERDALRSALVDLLDAYKTAVVRNTLAVRGLIAAALRAEIALAAGESAVTGEAT